MKKLKQNIGTIIMLIGTIVLIATNIVTIGYGIYLFGTGGLIFSLALWATFKFWVISLGSGLILLAFGAVLNNI